MNKAIQVIGIDCSTDARKTGLSSGFYYRFPRESLTYANRRG